MKESFIVNNTSINIDLNPGVYVFDAKSGIGKTYLTKCLKKANTYGHPVDGYTYDDLLRGITLQDYIGSRELSCIILDRFDLYKTKFIDFIEQLCNKCIILIDCKGDNNLDFDDCCINMSEHSIEVYSDEIYF